MGGKRNFQSSDIFLKREITLPWCRPDQLACWLHYRRRGPRRTPHQWTRAGHEAQPGRPNTILFSITKQISLNRLFNDMADSGS
jgi:hypothetical protein